MAGVSHSPMPGVFVAKVLKGHATRLQSAPHLHGSTGSSVSVLNLRQFDFEMQQNNLWREAVEQGDGKQTRSEEKNGKHDMIDETPLYLKRSIAVPTYRKKTGIW